MERVPCFFYFQGPLLMHCIGNYGMPVQVHLSPFLAKMNEFTTFLRVTWNRFLIWWCTLSVWFLDCIGENIKILELSWHLHVNLWSFELTSSMKLFLIQMEFCGCITPSLMGLLCNLHISQLRKHDGNGYSERVTVWKFDHKWLIFSKTC